MLFDLRKSLLQKEIKIRRKLKGILDKRRKRIQAKEKEFAKLKMQIKALSLRKKLTPAQKKMLAVRKVKREREIKKLRLNLKKSGKTAARLVDNFARNTGIKAPRKGKRRPKIKTGIMRDLDKLF